MSAAEIAPAKRPAVTARPPADRSWSIEETAYVLGGIGSTTVRELVEAGKLPELPRFGRRVTFDPKVVEAFRTGGAEAAKAVAAALAAAARRIR